MVMAPIPGSGIAWAHFKAEIVRIHDGYGPHRWSFDIPTLTSNRAIQVRGGSVAVDFANAHRPADSAGGERDQRSKSAKGREQAKLRYRDLQGGIENAYTMFAPVLVLYPVPQ